MKRIELFIKSRIVIRLSRFFRMESAELYSLISRKGERLKVLGQILYTRRGA